MCVAVIVMCVCVTLLCFDLAGFTNLKEPGSILKTIITKRLIEEKLKKKKNPHWKQKEEEKEKTTNF